MDYPFCQKRSYFYLPLPVEKDGMRNEWKQEGHSAGSGVQSRFSSEAGGVRGHVSSQWSDLAFFIPAPFISGEDTGLFAAGLAAEPSLLVSCSHLTCVAGP